MYPFVVASLSKPLNPLAICNRAKADMVQGPVLLPWSDPITNRVRNLGKIGVCKLTKPLEVTFCDPDRRGYRFAWRTNTTTNAPLCSSQRSAIALPVLHCRGTSGDFEALTLEIRARPGSAYRRKAPTRKSSGGSERHRENLFADQRNERATAPCGLHRPSCRFPIGQAYPARRWEPASVGEPGDR